MRIDGSGNVLVGTVNTSGRLTVESPTSQFALTPGDSRKVALFNYDNDIFNIGVEDGYAVSAIAFRNNAQERMRIAASGHVGIGTTIPSVKIQIDHPSNATFGTSVLLNEFQAGNSDGPRISFKKHTPSKNWSVGIASGNTVDRFSVFENGGPGSFGTERFSFKAGGQVRFQPLASDPAGAESGDVYYNSSSNKLKVYNGSSWVDLH
jgi:hypothetical protein